jgi:hypothetical protein
LPGQFRHARASLKSLQHRIPLTIIQRRGSPKDSTLSFGALQAGLRSFDQQVPLKLCHGINDTHGHPSGWAGEIHTTERQAVDPDTQASQAFNGSGHVDGVPAKPVQFCNDEHVITLKLVHEFDEGRALLDGGTSRNGLSDDPSRFDPEPCRFDFAQLVLRGLT